MSLSAKYHIADGVRFFAATLGYDPKPAILRAGLPADFLDGPEQLVTGPQYYDLWEGLTEAASDIPDLPRLLVDIVMGKELDSSGYSFFSSPTARVGIQRKALFKPLLMPLRIGLSDVAGGLEIAPSSPIAGRALPNILGWFDLTFILAIARKATGVPFSAMHLEAPALWPGWADAERYFGCPVTVGAGFRMVLADADVDRPLVTRNETGWEQVAEDMARSVGARVLPGTMAAKVRQALLEGLPGGQAGADQIGRMLGLSKRSLQRRLGEEGMQFKEILEDTRRGLALAYLQRRDLGMREIALLLGFRDPSSFFRAFKSWTGQTPQALRGAK